MKKRLCMILMALITAFSLACPGTAMADGQRVVTLGADLSDAQEKMILKYFGIKDKDSLRVLTITNDDEREHLGSFVPLEQIGTHTYSCAYVCPTKSGGIRVKTANLSWVTGNMIATTLSTSGIKNCDVIAAAPFRVSGTGALTGVIMAYEEASGQQLSESRKELATEELILTIDLADDIGQQEATEIVNEIKIQIIENNIVDEEEIERLVAEAVEKYHVKEKAIEAAEAMVDEDGIEIIDDSEEMAKIDENVELVKGQLVNLAKGIAAEGYEYEDVKDTLERVEENVAQDVIEDLPEETEAPAAEAAGAGVAAPPAPEAETEAEIEADSILNDTDDTALGEDVITSSTNKEDNLPTEEVQEAAPEQKDKEKDEGKEEPPAEEPPAGTEAPAESEEELIVEETEEAVLEPETEEIVTEPETEEVVTEPETEEVVTEPETEEVVTEPETEEPTVEETEAPAEPEILECEGAVVSSEAVEGLLQILINAENVVPVSGTVTIAGSEETVIDLTAPDCCIVVPATPEELEAAGLETGTKIIIATGRTDVNYLAEDRDIHVDLTAADAEGQEFHFVTDQVFAEAGFGVTAQLAKATDIQPGAVVNFLLNTVETEGTVTVSVNGEEQQVIDLAGEEREFGVTIPEEGPAAVEITYSDAEGTQVQTIALNLF